jgi:hypothetical protein
MLALAYASYQASLCPCGCGYPRHQSWDPERDGWYEPETITCYALAARQQWEAEHSEQEFGRLVGVVDTYPADPAARVDSAHKIHGGV